jgi:hypothetical protein
MKQKLTNKEWNDKRDMFLCAMLTNHANTLDFYIKKANELTSKLYEVEEKESVVKESDDTVVEKTKCDWCESVSKKVIDMWIKCTEETHHWFGQWKKVNRIELRYGKNVGLMVYFYDDELPWYQTKSLQSFDFENPMLNHPEHVTENNKTTDSQNTVDNPNPTMHRPKAKIAPNNFIPALRVSGI